MKKLLITLFVILISHTALADGKNEGITCLNNDPDNR